MFPPATRRGRCVGEVGKIKASDVQPDCVFGNTLAILGDTMIIGFIFDDEDGWVGDNRGAASLTRGT